MMKKMKEKKKNIEINKKKDMINCKMIQMK